MRLLTYNRSLELCARMNYETENLDFIDNIPPNSVFYDLGACEGRFSIYAALKGLKVYAFEPEKENYETLVANIKNNHLENNIVAFNVGVGEKESELILQIGQPWAGGHQKIVKYYSSREDLDFDFKTEQKINIVALDQFINDIRLLKPQYLKVDIDGSEIPFLEGAKKTLNDIRGMIFELNKKDKNYLYIIETLSKKKLKMKNEFQIPNEPFLYNIIFSKNNG